MSSVPTNCRHFFLLFVPNPSPWAGLLRYQKTACNEPSENERSYLNEMMPVMDVGVPANDFIITLQ